MTAEDPADLNRNLDALAARDPALADSLRHAPPLDPAAFEPSRAGPPTARLPDADGQLVQLASRVDPEREARRLIEGHLVEGPAVYVVVGLGLGYHVAELIARRGSEDCIIVAEGDPALVRSALERFDFTDALSGGYLLFLTSADTAEVGRRLQPLVAPILLGTHLIVHPASARLAPDFGSAFRRAFTDFVAAARVNMATLATNTALTIRNLLMNLPAYVTLNGIDHLKDACAGYPAIIVSAGPSLARNIDLLPQARDRAVIISVATTFRMLVDRGVEPHFVTCLDYHEISKRFFEDAGPGAGQAPPPPAATHLVTEPKATWHVLDLWRGPASVLGNDFLDACLRDVQPPLTHDRLPGGSTVAHLAFYLARYLGADPIVFVGQDLGFSDGLYYMPGTTVHDTWRPELNRFWTMEMKEWEYVVRGRGILRSAKDVHGRPMYTTEQMLTYLQTFEMDFHETAATVIDATEGGLPKSGAEVMALAEVLQQHAARPLPEAIADRLRTPPPPRPGRIRDVLAALHRRVAETENIRHICTTSIDLLEQIGEHLEDQTTALPLFAALDEQREQINTHQDAYRLVRNVAQADQLRRYHADRNIAAAGLDGVEKQRRQLERDLNYVTALAEDCDLFLDMLRGGIDRLEAFARPPEEGRA